MREIVCLHIGQCGVQLSNAAWELFCIEHGIQANGRLRDNLTEDDSYAFKTFFSESPNGQYVPRGISFDLEPTVIDEIRTGPYRKLFHPEQLVNSCEDAANNYARGHFTVGKNLSDLALDKTRRVIEGCDCLQGFFLMNGYGGGTGSGFSTLLLENLSVFFSKVNRYQIGIFPGNHLSTAIVEPYNAMLTVKSQVDFVDISTIFDNESIYNVCKKTLDLQSPTYSNLNRLTSQVFSSLSVSLRFESSLNSDLNQMITNLVPYPRIHFPITQYSPILSCRKADHESCTVAEITSNLFHCNNLMINAEFSTGKYMACCLQYRGDILPMDVNSAIFDAKKRPDVRFVDWCPTGFKIGINFQPPVTVPGSEMAQTPRSVTMLTNTSALVTSWTQLRAKFQNLFSRRSFIHWYVGEGMEEGEFSEAVDHINALINDYEEVVSDSNSESHSRKNSQGIEQVKSPIIKSTTSKSGPNSKTKTEPPSVSKATTASKSSASATSNLKSPHFSHTSAAISDPKSASSPGKKSASPRPQSDPSNKAISKTESKKSNKTSGSPPWMSPASGKALSTKTESKKSDKLSESPKQKSASPTKSSQNEGMSVDSNIIGDDS